MSTFFSPLFSFLFLLTFSFHIQLARAVETNEAPLFKRILTNIESNQFSEELLKKLESEKADPKNVSFIVPYFSNNDVLPDSYKWIAARLNKKGFKVKFIRQDENSLLKTAEDEVMNSIAEIELLESTSKDSEEKSFLKETVENLKSLHTNIVLSIRSLFGVPEKIALWVKINRTEEDEKTETKNALNQTFVAGITTSIGLMMSDVGSPGYNLIHKLLPFLKDPKRPAEILIAPGIAFTMGWVYVNMLKHRNITEVFSQGRSVKKEGETLGSFIKRLRESKSIKKTLSESPKPE
jgi:hypothetical protein